MIKKENDIDALIKLLEDEFGAGTAFRQTSRAVANVDAISTGSYSLDTAIGVGGLPRGKIAEIFGPESGGKTTLCLSIVAQAQKTGIQCAYIDTEYALDLPYAQKLGVNVESLIVAQPSSLEEALNITERLTKSGKVGLIIFDSVAAAEPKGEGEGDIGDQTMGLKARVMSQAMRKLIPLASKTNTLLVFINQIRMKIGAAVWGNPETVPGGKALLFASSVRIDIRRITTIKKGENPVGIQVKAKIVKNKVAPPFRVAEFSIMFGEGISIEADIFNTAVARSIIDKKGNTYYFGEEKLGVGAENSINTLKENVSLVEQIKAKI